jgi:hypothetical protein
MTRDLENLLPESIDRLARGERYPAGLTDRVLRRHRQRQLTMRAALATGTAAIAVAAVLGATAGPSGVGPLAGGQRVQTAAYIISRTERGLGTAEREGLIQEIHARGRHVSFLIPTRLCHVAKHLGGCLVPLSDDLLAPDAVIWTYRGQLRQEGFAATGRLVFDASTRTTVKAGRTTVKGSVANYHAKTWWHEVTRQLGQATRPTCSLPAPDGSAVDWPAAIRTALSCGAYHLAGHQRIGKINAIRLKANSWAAQTIWINPATYLPVRVDWRWRVNGRTGSLVGNYRWLKPTKANLAALRVRVPASFRRVRPTGLAEATFVITIELKHVTVGKH